MPAPVPATEIRARLLPAMAHLTAEKGYAAVTIDDLARAARISKRTFYAQFADKEACLLAAYDDAAALVYDTCERAAEAATSDGWRTQVDTIISTYLRCLAAQPAMTRVFHVEIQAAGAVALDRHLEVNRRYAALLRRLVREGGETTLSQPLAVALLGAVNELVLHAVADGRTARLPALHATLRPLFAVAISG